MGFIFNNTEILHIVDDFETFCSYIDNNKVKLTKKGVVLGKKDLFEINCMMFYKEDISAPNFLQPSYPLLNLFFELCISGNLYTKQFTPKGILYLAKTTIKDEFDTLNIYEKYITLLEIYCSELDFSELYDSRMTYEPISRMKEFIKVVSTKKPGQQFESDDPKIQSSGVYTFSTLADFIYHMSFFGFWSYEEFDGTENKQVNYYIKIKSITLNEFGIRMCKILSTHRLLHDWNMPFFYENYNLKHLKIIPGTLGLLSNSFDIPGNYLISDEQIESLAIEFLNEHEDIRPEPFYKAFQKIFPAGTLNNTIIRDVEKKYMEGFFVFKVSLYTGLWRKIKLSHAHTLLDLHYSIQEAFDFDNDHLYSFYMDGKLHSKHAFNCDMCDEGPYVDDAILGELDLHVGQRILYLFDYGDMWRFEVQLVEFIEDYTEDDILADPQIIESKGEAPEQYRYFE